MVQKDRILVVDDDEATRKSLTVIFDKKGYETETAATGQEALAKARKQFFNLALLDIKLSDMEGTELLAPLKEMHPDMALLIATGHASLKTAMRALNNGASGYLTKPLNIDELLAKIRDVLEKQHLLFENVRLRDALQQELAERKRVEEEIRRRNQELILLNQIIAVSATNLEPTTILETACHELALAFAVSQATAMLVNEKKTMMTVVAEYRAESQPTMLNKNISVEDNALVQYLLASKAPLVVSDVQNDPRLTSAQNLLRYGDTVSTLLLPLIIKQEVVGSLSLGATESRSFSPQEINLAWSVADQISGALARARLTQAHQRLFTAIEQTADSVMITDTEGTIFYVNPAFERTTGYSQAEVIGQNPRILKSDRQDSAFYKGLWETITAGKVWHGRFVNKKKDASFYTEDATISPVRDENGTIVNYVAVKRDVTRELELEAQYRQAQKMEMVGQLTGGIAHDFNNLLTAVVGFAELTQMRSSLDDASQQLVDKILYSGRRATDLVGQLMAFSRKQIIEPKVFNLNEIVVNIDKMLRRIIGEDTQMETILDPNLWPVKADPTQIEQVIVNLAVNARDAMSNGGQLTIETANVVLDDDYVTDHLGAQPGDHVLLAVSDTGTGMSKEVQEHLFEPFFTTKKKGKGSGLGLATVFGIVKQSDGHIWVYSEEGIGTTFKIYLPKSTDVITAALPQPDSRDDLPLGAETVLLVEDEPAVREMAAYTLRQQGYTVLEATNGHEALQLANTYTEEIDLLITDVIMPQMNGRELASQITAMRPNTITLFTSGYTDDAIVQHGILKPGIAFIPKPFSPSALARKVRETLDLIPSEQQ